MRLVFLFLIFAVSFTLSEGRETDFLTKMEDSVFQIRQRLGTDKIMHEWLSDAGVKEDTVYAFIYMPGSCLRCETGIVLYSKALKRAGHKFVLMTVQRDRRAAEAYNKKKGYSADYYIYDTENKYKDVFSFNGVVLNTPCILKITKSGRLISGYDGMVYSPELLALLTARTEPMAYKDFGDRPETERPVWMYPVSAVHAEDMGTYRDYTLDVSPDAPLGEIFRNPYFENGVFFYPDELLGGVSFFREKPEGGEFAFERLLLPTEREKMMFVNIDSADFNEMVADNGVHYIVCNAWMLDSVSVGMSYSLPRIFYEAPDRIAYFNKACMLSRRLEDLSADSCTAFDFNHFKDDYFYKHFQFSCTGDKIVLGCQKITWPVEVPVDYYKGKPGKDPFVSGFYDTDNPFMAVFDRRTGKLVRRFGHIDSIARKTFTGYYFVSPLSVANGGELAYTDSYSGKVYVADTSDLSKEKACYEVFSIDYDLLPALDTAGFYSYGHAKACRSVFCRCITDMRVTPDRLYCVVAYGDVSDPSDSRTDYVFVVIDRKSGARKEYIYPGSKDGYTVFTRGLRVAGADVFPFVLLKKEGEALLRVYFEK